jgi:predicted DNA-binding transcriptional regulator AlpA
MSGTARFQVGEAALTNDDPLLITEEVASRLRVSPRTLELWRRQHTGPRWLRSGRRVLYPESGIREYLSDRARQSA